MSDDIYKKVILDRYHAPQHKGELANASCEARQSNPLCGDWLQFWIRLDDDKIVDVGWMGEGCAISLASADMFSEKIMGMAWADINLLTSQDMLAMLGIDLGIARLKCATLALTTVQSVVL
jgi:nitrogen fixation NifU-like protein